MNDEALDAEESLVLAAREFLEAKVFVLEWHPIFMEESKEEQVGAESKLRLEEPQMSSLGGRWEGFVTNILAEEAVENSGQCGIEPVQGCEDL